MSSAKTIYILKITFTPLVILLTILYIVTLLSPYDYFKGNELGNLLAGIFPVCLLILLPIDIFLKVLLAQNIKRLWSIEVLVLAVAAIIGLLVIS